MGLVAHFETFPQMFWGMTPYEQDLCQRSQRCDLSLCIPRKPAPGLRFRDTARFLERLICLNTVCDLGKPYPILGI